ncbi:MAG: hypothetical protein HC836_39375 [Richelia sp. RM2_1_2]|nr:hypothetical protein [Richelia sp. RM2_1_2]
MASCELLSQRIGVALKKELDKIKVPVIRIEVSVIPIDSNAHITYIKEFKPQVRKKLK